jgi:cyanophycinase
MVGPLALVGSGEFLPEMEATDRLLLDAAAGSGHALIVPTASALEPGMPEEWADRGIRHFRERLGIEAQAALILNREQAGDGFVPLVETARIIYFSGGNPRYLTETMAGTPFLRAVEARWRDGAALAGCSAGAMMLGAAIQNIVGRPGETVPALGLVPGICVIPHFDRIEHYRPGALAAVRERRKTGIVLVGIDELTAAVCIGGAWHVHGKGTVLVVTDAGELTCTAGEKLPLALPGVAN